MCFPIPRRWLFWKNFSTESMLLYLILVWLLCFLETDEFATLLNFYFWLICFMVFFFCFPSPTRKVIYPESLRNHAFKLTNCWVLQNWRKLIISLYFTDCILSSDFSYITSFAICRDACSCICAMTAGFGCSMPQGPH